MRRRRERRPDERRGPRSGADRPAAPWPSRLRRTLVRRPPRPVHAGQSARGSGGSAAANCCQASRRSLLYAGRDSGGSSCPAAARHQTAALCRPLRAPRMSGGPGRIRGWLAGEAVVALDVEVDLGHCASQTGAIDGCPESPEPERGTVVGGPDPGRGGHQGRAGAPASSSGRRGDRCIGARRDPRGLPHSRRRR
jgi:hypothetical protein